MLLKRMRSLKFPDWLRQLASGWLCAVLLEYLLLPGELRYLADVEGLGQMSLIRVLAVTVVLTFGFAALPRSGEKYQRWLPVVLVAALIGLSLPGAHHKQYLLLGGVLLGAIVLWAYLGWDATAEPELVPAPAKKGWAWAVAAMAVVFFLFLSVWTVGRVITYTASTYDFGIFTQMFHNMAETGLPMTTVERDGLLSHFDVHVSPIYYLMLPFYLLVPRPETLQVLQALVLTTAAIPLWLICKNHGFSGWKRALVCALLFLLPAVSGGVGYDIHENCFLLPLILWLFYGIERKNIPMTAVFGVLTLMVKEDAAVYVAVVGLWLLIKSLLRQPGWKQWELIAGASLLAGAVLWFLAATGYLAAAGDGVMSQRYENYMYGDNGSLVAVLRAVAVNPLKALYECADPTKWGYILRTMLPLLGVPLLTRRFERYVLLIPYILVNLMSDYPYQYDVMFQYNFGSTACLLYLFVINLAELKWERLGAGVLAGAVLMAGFFCCRYILPRGTYYVRLMKENGHTYRQIQQALETVPQDASVTASTFFVPHLSQRTELYTLRDASAEHIRGSEYVVLKVGAEFDYARFSNDADPVGYDTCRSELERVGFRLCYELEGQVLIYQNTNN